MFPTLSYFRVGGQAGDTGKKWKINENFKNASWGWADGSADEREQLS